MYALTFAAASVSDQPVNMTIVYSRGLGCMTASVFVTYYPPVPAAAPRRRAVSVTKKAGPTRGSALRRANDFRHNRSHLPVEAGAAATTQKPAWRARTGEGSSPNGQFPSPVPRNGSKFLIFIIHMPLPSVCGCTTKSNQSVPKKRGGSYSDKPALSHCDRRRPNLINLFSGSNVIQFV